MISASRMASVMFAGTSAGAMTATALALAPFSSTIVGGFAIVFISVPLLR